MSIEGISFRLFTEQVIVLLEKRNNREFKEQNSRFCKDCGKEYPLQHYFDNHTGLICNDCYNKMLRKKRRSKKDVQNR